MGTGIVDLYSGADIVLSRAGETAVIFIAFVALTICLEKVFHSFRHHRSRYVRMLFDQVAEELQCVGLIALLIMLFASSISLLPSLWFTLFEWAHLVLFLMMIIFVANTVILVMLMRNLTQLWAYEETIYVTGAPLPPRVSGSHRERFFAVREIFRTQIRIRFGDDVCDKVSFAEYIRVCARSTTLQFTSVTYVAWMSLILTAAVNSLREYGIPGHLQTKDASEYTTADRLWNQLSLILLLGYVPLATLVVVTLVLQKRFADFLTSSARTKGVASPLQPPSAQHHHLDHHHHHAEESKKPTAKLTIKGRTMIVDASIFDGAFDAGEVMEDPSRYLIRGSSTLTLHFLKIPLLLLELYLSMFVFGGFYDAARNVGLWRGFLVPVALAPVAVGAIVLPWTLLMVTMLCNLGSRLNEKVIQEILHRVESDLNSEGRLKEGEEQHHHQTVSTTEEVVTAAQHCYTPPSAACEMAQHSPDNAEEEEENESEEEPSSSPSHAGFIQRACDAQLEVLFELDDRGIVRTSDKLREIRQYVSSMQVLNGLDVSDVEFEQRLMTLRGFAKALQKMSEVEL
eukprot:PhM_4_TR8791/c0_g1_i1/m.102313